MPSIATKDRQESSGKDTLMREAFMVRPSTAIPEIFTSPPQAAERSACRRPANSSVLKEVRRYIYVPASAPAASRTRMQRPIKKTLVFQHGLFGVPLIVTVSPPALFHPDHLAAVRAHYYFPSPFYSVGIRRMQLTHDIISPLGRRRLKIGTAVFQWS